MALKITIKELVDYACLEPITIYTEADQFEQPLLATVATVHYLHTVRLFHMQQPHRSLLTIVAIACVPTSRYEPYSVGLRESFTHHPIASRRDRYRLEKYFFVPYVHEFTSKRSSCLS